MNREWKMSEFINWIKAAIGVDLSHFAIWLKETIGLELGELLLGGVAMLMAVELVVRLRKKSKKKKPIF